MHIFQREKPKELQKESNEETTLHLFKSLPHYHRTILFRETNPEITTTESDQVAVNYYFSSLPHYQTNQKFKEPTLFVSKIENEENLFRNIPRIDVRSFQTPIPKRRKLVRVIKRKKIEDASEIPEIEFGRRIQPKITINSVADLPLENTLQAQTVFNSYGDLVLSQSS
ncbi:hypothetical protein Zmor_017605 [Zophobas morio]|uniref:Uncharacterized protein n=1 Tax=Zophobas morio TaxID=2755281 RepID=A0AA38MCC4_9CUCU|nr:hypothetical protein Zmor_017605 [Zophobas morio]